MCNCLQNFPGCYRNQNCGNCFNQQPCMHRNLYLVAAYPVNAIAQSYGPSSISIATEPTTVPYVYQYQNATTSGTITANNTLPYADLYLVNNMC